MVIVVATLLSTAAIQLKPFQDVNVVLEKKQNILSSVGVNILRDSANIIYPKYVKDELVLNTAGNIVEGSAFDLDLSVEQKEKSEQLPLFIVNLIMKKYIIPLRGKGLWGLLGFIAPKDDLNTVFGAVFDIETENLDLELK